MKTPKIIIDAIEAIHEDHEALDTRVTVLESPQKIDDIAKLASEKVVVPPAIPGKEGERGPKGDKGEKGDQGPKGNDATADSIETTIEKLNKLEKVLDPKILKIEFPTDDTVIAKIKDSKWMAMQIKTARQQNPYLHGGGSTSPLTTKGDVFVYGTVAGVLQNARLPVGTNNQVLTADSTQPLGVKWAASAGGISIFDTEKNILATTPSTIGTLAYATDRQQMMQWNGTNWYINSSYFDKDLQAPDRGWTQDSNRRGYGTNYITDKQLANVYLANSTRTDAGGIRYNPATGKIQVYLNNAWQNAVTGFTFQETWGMLQTIPNGYALTYNVFSGNSTALGINGRPLVQGYRASRGCYPPQQTLSGGTF